jgi:hypothetical protein
VQEEETGNESRLIEQQIEDVLVTLTDSEMNKKPGLRLTAIGICSDQIVAMFAVSHETWWVTQTGILGH